MSSQKKFVAATAFILICAFFVGATFFKKEERRKEVKNAQANEAMLIRDYSPSIGSSLLRVTVVEFLDPECESCRYIHPFMKDILKRYKGQIRYVVRYAPFHKNSKKVVRILEAARLQGKYWEVLDKFFEKLPEWGNHQEPKPELLWTYLSDFELDIEKIKIDMNSKRISDILEQEQMDLRRFGIRQTPSFFINGAPLQKFGPDHLENAIKQALGN